MASRVAYAFIGRMSEDSPRQVYLVVGMDVSTVDILYVKKDLK